MIDSVRIHDARRHNVCVRIFHLLDLPDETVSGTGFIGTGPEDADKDNVAAILDNVAAQQVSLRIYKHIYLIFNSKIKTAIPPIDVGITHHGQRFLTTTGR